VKPTGNEPAVPPGSLVDRGQMSRSAVARPLPQSIVKIIDGIQMFASALARDSLDHSVSSTTPPRQGVPEIRRSRFISIYLPGGETNERTRL